MQAKTRIRQGDCVLKLAAQRGVPWKAVWDHPENQELRRARKTPSILAPGDELLVPERERRDESGETEQRHEFRAFAPRVEIRVRVHAFGKPRAHQPFHVEVGAQRFDGASPTTDADGFAVCRIPADAERAILVIGGDDDGEEYELLLGHVDPIDTPAGQLGRLENLGYVDDAIADEVERLAEALRRFAEDEDLDGADPDDPVVQQRLQEAYGS
jgi:hypothetical protein